MTILELTDKKNLLKEERSALVEKAKVEKRKMNDDENTKFVDLSSQIDDLEKQIGDKEKELRGKAANPKPVVKRGFSLLRAINAVADGMEQEDPEMEVIEAGNAEMRKAALPAGKEKGKGRGFVIPAEYRATIQATVATAGMENVPEDKLSILEPLRNRLVMVQAGATYMTGLIGDISIPVYSGSNVGWKGEIAAADDGAGTFSEITLSPKRITAYMDISKQFLIQDSNSAEAMLRADLIRALSEKLESTLLGNAAGTATQPAGIGVGTPGTVATWADIVGLEEDLELANVYGDYVYVMHPSVKAALRTMSKDTGSGLFVLDGNGINGYRALSSNGVFTDGLIVGNWADYVIGQWGGIELTVDPYTQAGNGMIRLVINAYFDGKPRRPASFQIATV